MTRVSPQAIVFSYHKSGTSLLLHVMEKVGKRLGLTLVNHFGLVDRLDPEPDIVLLPHSLLRARIDWPYRAIRMIRDPRDIWVSGYLYHRHCDEEWCTNTDMDAMPPILWPRVDHAFAHRSEDWKRSYLERLGGKSYQQHLLDRSRDEGLEFELDGYTGCTIAAMRDWAANGAEALDVKLEDVMADFDGSMSRIFGHFGFTHAQALAALEVAGTEDVRRMDDATIATRPQIHSRTISKWRDILSAEQIAGFEASHGDLIRELGYALSTGVPLVPEPADADGSLDPNEWLARVGGFAAAVDETRLLQPMLPEDPGASGGGLFGTQVTGGDDVWLSADGGTIRPTVGGQGTYRFVVPSGTTRVRLESRRGAPADPAAPFLGSVRRLGLRVNEISIRSRAGEVVIPADDPRLVGGWYDAEHAPTGIWRWTDGSAELPWACVLGPAMVTVRCATLGEYPTQDAGY